MNIVSYVPRVTGCRPTGFRKPIPGLFWTELTQPFDSLVKEFFGDLPATQKSEDLFSPRLDLSENDAELIVKIDLPGISHDDINVDLNEDVLRIHGEKRKESTETEGTQRYTERLSGSFDRSIRLPGPVNRDQLEAVFVQGVLTIRLPKAVVQPATQRIAVKSPN